jgi:hypothetical protein
MLTLELTTLATTSLESGQPHPGQTGLPPGGYQPKLDILAQFMQRHGSRYRVDTHYVDNFGYNNTFCWNSILACVADPVPNRA